MLRTFGHLRTTRALLQEQIIAADTWARAVQTVLKRMPRKTEL